MALDSSGFGRHGCVNIDIKRLRRDGAAAPRGKSALEDYFDYSPELEAALKRAGKTELLEIIKSTNMDSGAIAYVRQNRALGLGHAVWCARKLVGDEPFAVLLPDDVIAAEKPCLQQMIEAYAETGGNMVAAMEVSPQRISSYGVLDIDQDNGNVVRAKGMVEKPKSADAPSNLAVIGRYILSPKIMTNLNKMKQGAGGEIQLTDAIAEEAASGQVFGFRFRGQRYDCGSKAGFLQATLAFALSRPDLSAEFSAYLHDMMALQKAAQ
jgi:UTP--glucose-1-phosphate uridylyltransferase